MPVTPLNKIEQDYFYYPYRRSAKEQFGFSATGPDRNSPLRYDMVHGLITRTRTFKSDGSIDPNPDPCAVSVHSMRPFSDACQAYINKAYGAFVERAHGEGGANLGEAFGEWRSSAGMVKRRALSLAKGVGSLRRGDFRGFLKAIQAPPKRRDRRRELNTADEVEDLWLEYHFGWSPLLGDIHGACEAITKPLPSGTPVFGTSRVTGVDVGDGQVAAYHSVFRVGGDVLVVNPNTYLLSQLGLINPVAIAWNLAPMSFVADWCFDISSFLNSFSDFAGCEITRGYHTGMSKYDWTIQPASNQEGLHKVKQVFMARRLGIPRPLPNWNIRANVGSSVTRAAHAVALLTQRLR